MIRQLIKWLRFGKITSRVICMDGGVPSEIEYYGRFGRPVGYWAYGAWDPAMPYNENNT